MQSSDDTRGAAPEANEAPGLQMTTLAELGPVLPLGIPDAANTLQRDFDFRRWTGKAMRDLGKLRDDTREINMADHVGLVFSVLAEKMGAHDFQKLKRNEQKAVVSSMFMGDVFYAYCYARVQAMGPELIVDFTCPMCRENFKYKADLNDMNVITARSIEDTYWIYTLEDPVQIRGRDVTELSMGPARWYSVINAQIQGQYDLEGGKLAVAAGAIRGPVGREQYPLAQREIDELSGRDIEGIIAQLDSHYIGPDLRIETQCPNERCKTNIAQMIDWSYNRFFAASSRFLPGGKSTTSYSQ